jgi:simple sugar transport system permease protein
MEEIIGSTIRLSTPLILAAIGGMFSERAGVVNIALEGKMLFGAFAAAWGTLTFGNPWAGLACAVILGSLAGLLHALLCVRLCADQIVAGTAINLLAVGLTPLLCKVSYGASGSSPAIPMQDRFGTLTVPLLSDIPLIGPILFGQNVMVYLMAGVVIAAALIMQKTSLGIRVRAVGDHPDSAATAGIDVLRLRFNCVIAAGAIAAAGGAFLSIAHGSGFTRNMTSGRGFMALAALIFGKWKPVPACLAALLFGLTDVLQIRLQGAQLMGISVPVQAIQIIPYVVVIVVLAGLIGNVKAPLAIGKAWRKQ